jgi:hypothetical protein
MNMENIAVVNFYIFLIVGFIGIFMGLNLKMWTSWLYGLYGFLTGFLLGFVFLDPSSGLQLGAIFAFAVMFGGASVRRGREKYK